MQCRRTSLLKRELPLLTAIPGRQSLVVLGQVPPPGYIAELAMDAKAAGVQSLQERLGSPAPACAMRVGKRVVEAQNKGSKQWVQMSIFFNRPILHYERCFDLLHVFYYSSQR